MIVHVTDVSAWGLYTKCMICMLQVGVNCAGIICTIACYGISTTFLIVIVNMELLYYPIYCSRLGVSVWIVSAEFVSSRFCRVQFQSVSLHDCDSR